MKKPVILTILIGLWTVIMPILNAPVQAQDAPAPDELLLSQEICANTAVPAGWIVTDMTAQSFRCGVGVQTSVPPIYNVWTIEKISDMYVGDRVLVCDSSTTPPDWIVIERQAVSFRCGIQVQTSYPPIINVKVIERVNGPVRPPGGGTRSPIGTFEIIDQASRTARGWSLDPDNPQASNRIEFYIDGPAGNSRGDGTGLGLILANQPRLDVNQNTGYPGNHGFTFSIPVQYHNCQNHTLYAYALDTGSNPTVLLTGSPKTFNFCTPPPPPPSQHIAFDFNNDGRADPTVFRSGDWYSNLSPNSVSAFTDWGQPGDVPVAADYDGDGKTDYAVFRREAGYGYWYVLQSSNGAYRSFQYGLAVDKPVPADYDGDFKADSAVFRPENGYGYWYILNSSTNQSTIFQYGRATDTPVPADYDGDGKADSAVTRIDNNYLYWYLNRSSLGYTGFQFGLAGDKAVPADYDGDHKTDVAVYRNGDWYLQRSRDGFTGFHFGLSGDTPTPADYDGDGKTDAAVFRPSGGYGYWYILQSSNNQDYSFQYGLSTDIPIPGNPQQ